MGAFFVCAAGKKPPDVLRFHRLLYRGNKGRASPHARGIAAAIGKARVKALTGKSLPPAQ